MDGTDVITSEKPEATPTPTTPSVASPIGKPPTWQSRQQQAQSTLQGMFQQAAADVRVRASGLEENVLRPAGVYAGDLAQRRPIASTFMFMLALLSALPIATFLGFALLAALFILGTALSLGFLLLGAVLCAAGGVLLVALVISTGMAFALTLAVIGSWLVIKLTVHLRLKGVHGMADFVYEVKEKIGADWAWERREKMRQKKYAAQQTAVL
ncbi:hypothetical protein CALCODRAFT_493873 [Calocera cornea HHB12733]|uniref:Uncharacterized protein n=1 Tax=Calocera cornea HHB12733 TaxID=1353952 RepID=A0A165HHB7_9BASI|nr:hypothetical protein CALCODRAFT_493873 [Calocera cornea HHB12733]